MDLSTEQQSVAEREFTKKFGRTFIAQTLRPLVATDFIHSSLPTIGYKLANNSISLFAHAWSRRYSSNQFARMSTAARTSCPWSNNKSMLLKILHAPKQCDKLLLGFTAARNSLQFRHWNRKYPSLCFAIGPNDPKRLIVNFNDNSSRVAQNKE